MQPVAPTERLAIKRLEESPHTPENLNNFFASRSFPIVEGPSVTFVYRGEADAVLLKHWVYGLPSSQPLQRMGQTDVWYLTIELPAGSRVEYKFEVLRWGAGKLIEDPLNRNRARDPFGANSVVHATGYEIPEWARVDPESREGVLDDWWLESRALEGRRRVKVYLPARFRRNRRYPLLVVHDGGDYIQYAAMKIVLDNLIHRLEIPDVIVAFTYPENRLVEYANDARHARFVTEEVVPRLESALPLIGRPRARCLMGASFGAVASLSTAWRTPGFYGRLLLQSGSFAFTDIGRHNHRGPLFDPVVEFVNKYRSNPSVVSEKLYVSCGMYESLIYENRSLVPLLQATGMDVRYVESRDGHNWENWRDRMREGLSWLFPGPLMLVYE